METFSMVSCAIPAWNRLLWDLPPAPWQRWCRVVHSLPHDFFHGLLALLWDAVLFFLQADNHYLFAFFTFCVIKFLHTFMTLNTWIITSDIPIPEAMFLETKERQDSQGSTEPSQLLPKHFKILEKLMSKISSVSLYMWQPLVSFSLYLCLWFFN